MWFAALSDARSNPWFLNFMNKLHSGSKPVLSLHDPFLDHPPRYLKIKSAPLFFRHILRKGRTAAKSGDANESAVIGPSLGARNQERVR